ncbi:antitoxin Xre/MbcA/ParS toxin-binding domain-containing protein [Sphaerotilus sp.]|uniref:type II RES/Xre toxin-antitoxin system antitoxin n=1 Tax=Sphaerotilus sp. TaxID=2093942 RepID=UPI00286D9700|nr:antitoxin Xre/MbcA/ParS toxin-binding domain-containing protein [Sphaerotilus sp.]
MSSIAQLPKTGAGKRRPPSAPAMPFGLATLGDLSPLQRHDMVTLGVPVLNAKGFMDSFTEVTHDLVLKAVGISERTLQRGKTPDKRLDVNASDRTLRLATVLEQAVDVLGSRAEAEHWLVTPASGLDLRRPIELLQTSEGTELVKTLLVRMDYGVYA